MQKLVRLRPFVPLALALALVFTTFGCGHPTSDTSDGAEDDATGLSSADREAQAAVMAELQRHWAKGPDGWTTAIISGSPYAPDHFLRQCRALVVQELKPQDLSEADKQNGFEWVGRAIFKSTICREGGGQAGLVLDGMSNVVVNKQSGRWSQWVDFTPGPLRFEKDKGRWQFHWDSTYLRGTLPGPQDFATAGVR
ncbi:MAG: hypothetical protein WAN14_24525 [Candidatus Acidiferrales bacterium]